jgi:hypothetical protein
LLFAVSLGPAACSPGHENGDAGPESSACLVGFLGDGGAPDFEFLVLQAGGKVAPLSDGGSVPMLLPPQGDRYIFPGVRATNVDGCQLHLVASLRDLSTRRLATEQRYINLLSTGDGWGVSGVPGEEAPIASANFANVQVCPNFWSATDIYGQEYALEMTIQDRGNRQVAKAIDVTPFCGEPENLGECLCICRAGYVLGQACADGGSGDAGIGDGDTADAAIDGGEGGEQAPADAAAGDGEGGEPADVGAEP